MKAFVIMMRRLGQSKDAARRCIRSGREHGVDVDIYDAIVPADGVFDIMEERGFPRQGCRNDPYSRIEPCTATFLSHSSLWRSCASRDEPYLILEHDAVFVAPIPELDVMCCNLGKPSFGTFTTPPDGLGALVSKGKFGGAHGYQISPEGAKLLLAKAKTDACATDRFLNIDFFPWLTEYHPWPIICDDSFSTIQKEEGCKGKHNKVTPI